MNIEKAKEKQAKLTPEQKAKQEAAARQPRPKTLSEIDLDRAEGEGMTAPQSEEPPPVKPAP